MITSFTKMFRSVNSTFLHRNYSFTKIKSALVFHFTSDLSSLSAIATFPLKTLLIFNSSHLASVVVMKQSLGQISNNPLNFTRCIVTLINEGLRTVALHKIELDFSNVGNTLLSDDCLGFL